jgi:hypothetical protein
LNLNALTSQSEHHGEGATLVCCHLHTNTPVMPVVGRMRSGRINFKFLFKQHSSGLQQGVDALRQLLEPAKGGN